MLSVYFRPPAFGASPGEFLQPRQRVEGFLLTVDPAIAKRLIKRFSIGEGLLMGIFIEDAQAYTLRLRMVFLQPNSEIR